MKDQLISFKTASLAKEKGFQIMTINYAYVKMPTQSLLQKWLREEHNIHILVAATGFKDGSGSIPNRYDVMYFKDICKNTFDSIHETYEEALEEGLQQALILLKYEDDRK